MSDVIRDGASRKLVWGADASGRFRAREYFENLHFKEQARFDALFRRLADTGQIKDTTKFVKEPGDIYCFKCHSKRIACFFDGQQWVLIDGFGKKTNKSKRSRRRLQTASRLRNEYLKSK